MKVVLTFINSNASRDILGGIDLGALECAYDGTKPSVELDIVESTQEGAIVTCQLESSPIDLSSYDLKLSVFVGINDETLNLINAELLLGDSHRQIKAHDYEGVISFEVDEALDHYAFDDEELDNIAYQRFIDSQCS